MVARSRREAQKAAIEAQQLGQYRLERKLGSGGMGVVYKGHHAMLRRPTAIKMLDVDKVNEASIERFEREVQITCQLNNPNTVAIYDYGRTPEGVFYYAMEYLDGIDLQALVERYGPQPEARVIHILEQICGSLYEAHSLGLVHRDIKPANIMLNRRGGEPDVVKVLDFGLVKALDEQKQAGRTQTGVADRHAALHVARSDPDCPTSVDARSDLYAVGAVGYFLLTGAARLRSRQRRRTVPEARRHAADSALRTHAYAHSRRARSGSLGLPGKIAREASANRPRPGNPHRPLPRSREWSIEDADAWWGRHERGQTSRNLITAARQQHRHPPPRHDDRPTTVVEVRGQW